MSAAGRRLLVATEGRCPSAALDVASAMAGRDGEVVLACVLVVPHAQPIGATLDRAVADACSVLDAGEASVAGPFDTRLLRARSFSEGVLGALAAEEFDVLVIESGGESHCNGLRAQVEALMERAGATVVLVRPGA